MFEVGQRMLEGIFMRLRSGLVWMSEDPVGSYEALSSHFGYQYINVSMTSPRTNAVNA